MISIGILLSVYTQGRGIWKGNVKIDIDNDITHYGLNLTGDVFVKAVQIDWCK